MRLQIDVAEHRDFVAAGAQRDQRLREYAFVGFPARIARDEFETERLRLPGDDRQGNRVRATTLAGFLEHHQ